MNDAGATILAIVSGIIGLAIIAVILAPKAQTSSVIKRHRPVLETC